MYTRACARAAIRGVGGRWGSSRGRFRRGVTLLTPLHHVLAAIITLTTITASMHHHSRCAGR